MIKLKKTIGHLDDAIYSQVQAALIKNKADNFLFLFESYRDSKLSDEEISEKLKLTSNSFYVLKSRLYDKVQEFLSGDIHSNKEEVLKLLHEIPLRCYSSSREVATAYLEKLEKDLLFYDMHPELLVVYSALKKIHLYSEKYFHYSQLYNKHVAFSMSLEKSEDLLGNFVRVLGQYNFSRSPKLLETLQFLRKSVVDHFSLNQSRQIEMIKNLMDIQLDLFCDIRSEDQGTEEKLRSIEKILVALPESSPYKTWSPVVDYLFFEYYRRIGETGKCQHYFELVEVNFRRLLLFTNICLTSLYLISRIEYLQQQAKISSIENSNTALLADEADTHSLVLLGIFKAMVNYYKGQYKSSIAELNSIININSFKDYFHINTDIKLTLAYFYIQIKEFDLADNLLKNIQRKIKSEKLETHTNVLDLIKVFSSDIKSGNGKTDQKQKDNFLLFTGRNTRDNKLLNHLQFELKKRYS